MTKDKLYGSRDSDHAIVHSDLNISSSAHNYGCLVDGGNANGSDLSIIIIINNKNTIIIRIILIHKQKSVSTRNEPMRSE